MTQLQHADTTLSEDVLIHLEAQLASARGLLQVILEQGTAIRNRDVTAVVTLTGVIQGELQRRRSIEEERSRLLERAGARLGVDASAVTLSLLCELMDPATADQAQASSAELRGLLEVVRREHHVNRVLMNQELAFLDHLLRLAGNADTGYDAGGDRATVRPVGASAIHRVLDLEV
jgi:hypothetical protein